MDSHDWQEPEIEDWEDDPEYRENERQFLFGSCFPRQSCFPRESCFPRQSCFPRES